MNTLIKANRALPENGDVRCALLGEEIAGNRCAAQQKKMGKNIRCAGVAPVAGLVAEQVRFLLGAPDPPGSAPGHIGRRRCAAHLT